MGRSLFYERYLYVIGGWNWVWVEKGLKREIGLGDLGTGTDWFYWLRNGGIEGYFVIDVISNKNKLLRIFINFYRELI